MLGLGVREARERGEGRLGQRCVQFSGIIDSGENEDKSPHPALAPLPPLVYPHGCPCAPEMRRDGKERVSGLFQNSCYPWRVTGRRPTPGAESQEGLWRN